MEQSVSTEQYESHADLLKVLGHPVRLCIVNGLLHKGACNVSYMQECLNMPQSTVSQHISILKNKGIIKGTRKGLEISYTVVNPMVIELMATLMKYTTAITNHSIENESAQNQHA